jgi:hypothetical protein
MDEATIRARIEELLRTQGGALGSEAEVAGKLYQGAITMLQLTHGENSPQIKAFTDLIASHQKKTKQLAYQTWKDIANSARGVLKSLAQEVDNGLVRSLRREVTGEVLGDLLQLAKATLDQGTDNCKNVAAVLAAAAFEDTIRRLGTIYCGIEARIGLQDILSQLKDANILKGSQVGVVQAHFQFRNDALHADWNKIDKVAVGTVISLVQELLLKHF